MKTFRMVAGFTTLMSAATMLAAPASAQQVVGRLPTESVIHDLNDGQRFGVFTGWLATGRDPAGVRAHSAPLFGVRYDLIMGAPAYLSLRMFGMKSDHDVVDPNAPAANRAAGTATANQIGGDASLQISLTGERTWHGVQPLVNIGIGVIAGVANHFDAGKYAPGASVVYSYGLSARMPTGKNGDFRLDLCWLIYQVRYPETFRVTTASDNVAIRATGSLTPLTTNRAITFSYTWGLFR